MLLLPCLPGCGGDKRTQSLNDILAEKLDLTEISPEDIDLASSNLNEIYVTEAPISYI